MNAPTTIKRGKAQDDAEFIMWAAAEYRKAHGGNLPKGTYDSGIDLYHGEGEARVYLDNLADGFDEPADLLELITEADEPEAGLANFGAAHPDSPHYAREVAA